MCPKCKGLLLHDHDLERQTHSYPGLYCVNCGNRLDFWIIKNREHVILNSLPLGKETSYAS